MNHLRLVWSERIAREASGQLYWRVHPNDRPFGPEDATSTTWTKSETLRGYSCFDNPWHLWIYLDAAQIYGSAKSQTFIAFSGERVGTGNDGEDLVVPDMRTVDRMSMAEFEAKVLTYPLPASPAKGGQGRSEYGSWAAYRRMMKGEFEPGDDPRIDAILTKRGASWRGLMEGPVWTLAPAVILVDKLGRQSTFEVYVEGRQIGRASTLTEAKERAEKRRAEPLRWSRYRPAPQEADHYFFGPTTEFTDPTIAYLGVPVDDPDAEWDEDE